MNRNRNRLALAVHVVLMVIAAIIVVSCSGCAAATDRYNSSHERHPCGNIWNVCPGDNATIDRIGAVLTGSGWQ